MKKIILTFIVTLLLFSCQSENQKQNIVKEMTKQEISEEATRLVEEAVAKIENNSNIIIENEKSEWSFFDWEIKFSKCDNILKYWDNISKYKNKDKNIEIIEIEL